MRANALPFLAASQPLGRALTVEGEMGEPVQTVLKPFPPFSGSKRKLPKEASTRNQNEKVLFGGLSAYTDAFTRAGGSP